MAAAYLIDSNVFIDYAGKRFSGLAEQKLDAIFNKEFHYSIISRMEVLYFEKAYNEEINDFSTFLNFGIKHDVGLQICDQVIKLKRSVTKKNLPDLIIAATAITNNYILLTRNAGDFKNIPGLRFENPWDWE